MEHAPDKISYEDLGKWLRRVRTQNHKTQDEIGREYFHVHRSVYSKYETGKARPQSWQDIETFAQAFHENVEDVWDKVSIAIPDTSALLKNKHLLLMLLEDYDQVVIPNTVTIELSSLKNQNRNRGLGRDAWLVLSQINACLTEYPERVSIEDSGFFQEPDNDHRIIALAQKLSKKVIGDVVIINDDIDFPLAYDKSIKLADYIIGREKATDFQTLLDLDKEYRNFQKYGKQQLNLNAYLVDGSTLLIHCIRNRKVPAEERYRKLHWLIAHGADINKNDNSKYCLPPLAHCIQINDRKAFNILLNAGCDYNKASRDETTAGYLKLGKINEGNTPLMIACWHGKMWYVQTLCQRPGISLNQQDSNGFTAMMKCAVAGGRRKKAGKSYANYENLYRYLLHRGADPLIRDRNNKTAKDWWENPE